MKYEKSHLEIAKIAKVSRSYVCKVLNGLRIPRLHKAKSIADALGISLDTLYFRLKVYYEEEENK